MGYYAGIDMAARSSHVCIIDNKQRIIVDEKVPNHVNHIDEVLAPYRRGLSVVVEAGFNWYWIVDHLIGQGITTTLAHPVMLKAITTAKVKTDRRDAIWLARLLRGGLIPESHICPIEQRRIRDLCRLRWRFSQRHGTSLRQMRQVVTNEGYHSETVASLRNMDVEALNAHQAVRDICQVHQNHQLHITETLSELDEVIRDRINHIPHLAKAVSRVQAIPGFGPVNASTIVLESGDINRFSTQKHYCSYARLSPGIAQSGESIKPGRAHKSGNEHLKRSYTNAAMVAARCSPAVKRFKEMHLNRREHHRARNIIVNNIVAHKLATAIYCMLTNDQPWQEKRLFRT